MYKPLNYWYDAQQRRFLEQVIIAFSGFKYETGYTEVNGVRVPPQKVQVACTMALTDRQVASILRNNSDNALQTVPRITIWQTDLKYNPDRLQNQNFIGTVQVIERQFDEVTGRYVVGANRGRSSTVERLMPLPFDMTIQVDLWTATLDQKYQLSEQILTVCTPDFAIQNSDNAVDWTALTTCKLESINWSSRSIPVGTDNQIDIMTLTFSLPIWLSPPAKVTQQNVIEEVITNIHAGLVDETDILSDSPATTNITTPGDHAISVVGGVITLLNEHYEEMDDSGNTFSWAELINLYDANLRPTISTIHLKTSPEQLDDWTHDLVGTIQPDPSASNRLLWTLDPDTLPANTLPPIDGIVNPHKVFVGNGLPNISGRVRYLLTDEIGSPNMAWGNLVAKANDIVEYAAGQWTVLFTPVIGGDQQYVLNANSGEQIRWNGSEWVKTIDGIYPEGFWRIRF